MRIKSMSIVIVIIILCSTPLGCGYKLMGRGGQFPDEITSLAIGPLENKTKEANLGAIFVSALRREFIYRHEVEIVSEQKAQATLQGTITSITVRSLAYDEEARAREYRVTITLDLLLIRRENNEILWQGNAITGSEEYFASSDVMVEEGRKNAAIRMIADDLAETTYIKIKERF
jgi:outer membrane lipopolysaccharide assembly protein LptE/RlpB